MNDGDPGGLTWRELDLMASGVEFSEWNRMSALIAELWNTVKAKGVKPLKPSDFNPYNEKGCLKPPKSDSPSPDFVSGMKSIFPSLKGTKDA